MTLLVTSISLMTSLMIVLKIRPNIKVYIFTVNDRMFLIVISYVKKVYIFVSTITSDFTNNFANDFASNLC